MPTLAPAELSRQLRLGQTADLTRRRWIIGLSLVTVAAGQIVSLYQTGIISHLPDPPIPIFDEGLFYIPAAKAYLAGLADPNFEHPPLGKLAMERPQTRIEGRR